MRLERLVDLVADRLELGDRLGGAVRLEQGEAVQVAVARVGLLAADEPAVLGDQGLGLADPAELQQDVGEPPGQVGVVAAGLEQAGAPAPDRLVGPLLGELDQALDSLTRRSFRAVRGDWREVLPRRRRCRRRRVAASAAASRTSTSSGSAWTARSISAAARSGWSRASEVAGPGQVGRAPASGAIPGRPRPAGRGPGAPCRGRRAARRRGGPAARLPRRRRARSARRPRTRGPPRPGPWRRRRRRQPPGLGQEAVRLGVVAAPPDQLAGQGLGGARPPAAPSGQLDQPPPRLLPGGRRVAAEDLVVDLDRLQRLRLVAGALGQDLGLQVQRVEVVGVQLQVAVQVAEREMGLLPLDPPPRLVQQGPRPFRSRYDFNARKPGTATRTRTARSNALRRFSRRLRGALLTLLMAPISSVRSAPQLLEIS